MLSDKDAALPPFAVFIKYAKIFDFALDFDYPQLIDFIKILTFAAAFDYAKIINIVLTTMTTPLPATTPRPSTILSSTAINQG